MKSQGITIKQIAKELNISGSTVSRVLAGNARKYRISEKTEAIVKAAAEKHDFKINQIAQNLRLKKTNTIGLLIPDIANPFFANLASIAERRLRNESKFILLGNTNDNTAIERDTLEHLTARQVDGLLIAPVGLTADHFDKYRDTPIVFIDRYFEGMDLPYVTTNNALGARLAMEHLLQKGHSQIGCIQGLTQTRSNQDRLSGITEAMANHQISDEQVQIIGDDFSIENGYQSVLKLMRSDNPPTAIFTLSNQIAIGALKGLKELSLDVPNDVSLITFDEQPYFELTSPPLTTIKQPVEAISQKAVEMLLNIINGQPVQSTLLDPEIIDRSSVKDLINHNH